MLSHKIIATQITNLTDARYFAARGIDYLLFDLDEISIDKIFEINEWVEGPKILLLFSESTLGLIDECIIKINPTGISNKNKDSISQLTHLEAHTEIFQWSEEVICLEDIEYNLVRNLSNLDQLREDDGVILHGGSEDDIGIKSFDDLDDILDQLEV